MKNANPKILSIVLTLSLLVSGSFLENAMSVKAKAKIALNKKKITLTVGKKTKLKLKNYKKKVKWSTSRSKVAAVNKAGVVTAKKKGTAKITAKAGKRKYTCKVTVKGKNISINTNTQNPGQTSTPAPNPSTSLPPFQPVTTAPSSPTGPSSSPMPTPTLIYDLAEEPGKDPFTGTPYTVPIKCPYSELDYDYWFCPAILYDHTPGSNIDYRNKELKYSITIENSGDHDLPELGFSLNYTIGGTDKPYPYMFHVIDSDLRNNLSIYNALDWDFDEIKKDDWHKHATIIDRPIKKDGIYTYNFTFTIPSDAINGDRDPDTNINKPILFYIPNHAPFRPGDEITIKDCKISISDGTPVTNPVEVIYEPENSNSDIILLPEKNEMYLENFTELKNVILEEGTLNEIQNTVNLERKVTVNGTTYDTLTKYRQGGSNGKFFFSLSDESFNMGLNLSILPDYPQISEFNLWESVTSLNSLYFEGSALVDITKYTKNTPVDWKIETIIGTEDYWNSKTAESIELGISVWNQLFNDLNLSCTMKDLGFASYNE